MERRFGLIHATALNMTNMIGIGPFITIPLLMSALGGPQAMLGWLVALVVVLCDGMVWSELGAALPGSGGSFGYLRQGYGAEKIGRLMGFLFVWQFVLSGPLEIASGYIGFSQYLGYIWKGITPRETMLVVTVIGLANLALLYRRITSIATITLALWIGTIAATSTPGWRSTFRRARSTSPWAFSWASAPPHASASTTTSGITMCAISVTKSRTPAG